MSYTAVIETFYKYVKMNRLPLSEIIFVDKVYLELYGLIHIYLNSEYEIFNNFANP